MEIKIPYRPRPQFIPYHKRTERWAKIVAHRRAGKTVATLNGLIREALTNTRQHPPPRYAYIAPTYSQAKDIAWSYLKYYASVIPGSEMRESELAIIFPNKAQVRLYGAQEGAERLRGLYHDAVVIDEPAMMDPRAWPEVIRPTLSDYAGRATFVGTPCGRDWFYKIDLNEDGTEADGWFRLTLKASETGIIPQDELESLKAGLTDDAYLQEFEASFDASVRGAYYGKWMQAAEAEGRITSVPHEPTAQVFVSFDLGIRDSCALWFAQLVGKEIRWFDYLEASGVGLDYYVQQLRAKNYVYAAVIVPHDIEARELGTGKSRLEVLQSLGVRDIIICPQHRVEDGINAVRTVLPRSWFDRSRCYRGIDALKLYRSEYDDKLESLKPRPVHDWTSHAADSARYMAMCIDNYRNGGFSRDIKYPKMGYV